MRVLEFEIPLDKKNVGPRTTTPPTNHGNNNDNDDDDDDDGNNNDGIDDEEPDVYLKTPPTTAPTMKVVRVDTRAWG